MCLQLHDIYDNTCHIYEVNKYMMATSQLGLINFNENHREYGDETYILETSWRFDVKGNIGDETYILETSCACLAKDLRSCWSSILDQCDQSFCFWLSSVQLHVWFGLVIFSV